MKKKEVQISDSDVDLFVPPPAAPVPQKKVKGKKALPSTTPPQVKGRKALPSAPLVDPPTSKRHTRSTIPSETTPLGVGDWLTHKDIVCWLNQQLCHMEMMNHVRGLYSFYIFLWLPPGMFPNVTGHLLCFCWGRGFSRALDLLRMVVWSKNCVLNVKPKMFPHFGKMLPNMFPNMPDDVVRRPRR